MTVPTIAITSAERYVQKGLSKEAACAIISVLYAGESGLNPGPQPGTSGTDTGGILYEHGAMGIASWNGPRQKDLANFAARKGLSAWDLNTQLDFVLTECANNYKTVWDYIQNGKSYTTIIPTFVREYERPKDPATEIERAITFARELYPHISAAPIPSQPTTPQIPTLPVSTTMPILQIIQIIQAIASIMEALHPVITQIHQDLATKAQTSTPPAIPQGFDVSALAQELGPLLSQILSQMPHPTQVK